MKKLISSVLIFAFMLTFPFMTYASVDIDKVERKIVLPLSISEEDSKLLNDPVVQKGNRNFFKLSINDKTKYNESNNLMLNVSDIKIVENVAIMTGTGQFELGYEKYKFSFNNASLNVIVTSNGRTVYDGSVEIYIDKEFSGDIQSILDITILDDFTKGTISLTMGELDGSSGLAMLFWGDLFPEQQEVFKMNSKNQIYYEDIDPVNEINELGIMAANGYGHVGNAMNKSIGGTSYTKEMVVMSVSKADFRDRQSDLGNEMIRIFSRSYNVSSAMASVLLAQPTSFEAIFLSKTSDFLDIDQTTPRSGNNSMNINFPILEYLYPELGPVLAYVNLALSSLSSSSSTLSDALGDGHYNKAVVKSNITTGYDYMDLPSSTTYSNAHTNTSRGASVEIDYEQRPDAEDYANVEAKARITYRLYLNTDRTSSATTGYASYSHVVYGY